MSKDDGSKKKSNVLMLVSGGFSVFGAVRGFAKARQEGDRLVMVRTVLTGAAAVVGLVIAVRDLRDGQSSSRVVELEEDAS